MRLLIHYVGDIHQPLHSSSRVNHETPAGDLGGNTFKIKSVDGAKNLHALWDSVNLEDTTTIKLPFSTSDWNSTGDNAMKLYNRWNTDISSEEAKDLDPVSWADEAFKLAEQTVYSNITEGEEVSQDYIEKNQPVIERQIVLAGIRLSNLLQSLDLDSFNVSMMSDTEVMSQFQQLMPEQYEFFESFVQPYANFSV